VTSTPTFESIHITESERKLRRDALAIFQAALAAVDPAVLVRGALSDPSSLLPSASGRLIVLAVGKASLAMARAAHEALGPSVSEGIVLAPRGTEGDAPPGFRLNRGGHPLPDADGMAGALLVQTAAREAGPDDRVLLLLSGGGSALLTLPHAGITLDDMRQVTGLLLKAGATINELNAVRKHLEVLKGGRLAVLASPAQVSALVLSDVVGDPLDVIASGPVSPDPSTFVDAVNVLRHKQVWDALPASVRRHLEEALEGGLPDTPKDGDPVFRGVHVRVIGNAALAAATAAREAERLGYRSQVETSVLTGEARDVGTDLARRAVSASVEGSGPACQIFAGETTVTVRGDGRGGRNQELALAASIRLEGREGALVFSAGTDGIDGPTDAAGALATASTLPRARALGLDPGDFLARNDSYAFFDALGDLVMTGPTGTNVMDLMLAMSG
jgi:glycerate 2-kinase